jgi:hypothetical protein
VIVGKKSITAARRDDHRCSQDIRSPRAVHRKCGPIVLALS